MIAAVPVFVFVIVALAGFLLLSARKFWKYSRLPIHSRLELYPVPKEGGGRNVYGGSYFEEEDWWEKPRRIDRVSETVDIMKEMLFIKKLFVNQRSLWWASYLFHLGIYVMFAWSILLAVSVFWHPAAVVAIVGAVGALGFALSTVGAVLLLVRRLADHESRKYETPAEFFNLILILAVLLSGIASWLLVASPFEIAAAVLTLAPVDVPPLVVVHLVLLGIMLLYIPLSKMSHYVGKYFAFRSVQWDNNPNLAGSKVDQKTRAAAAEPVQAAWSAPHTRPDSSDEQEA